MGGDRNLTNPDYIGTVSTNFFLTRDGPELTEQEMSFYFVHTVEDGYTRHLVIYKGTPVLSYLIMDGIFTETLYKGGVWEGKLLNLARQFSGLEQIAARPKIPASVAGQLALLASSCQPQTSQTK